MECKIAYEGITPINDVYHPHLPHIWLDLVLLQPLRWHCVECAVHHEWNVREEHPYGAVQKWRHTILGKNLPLPPHISSQIFNPPFKYHVTISNPLSPYICNYEFPSIVCLPRQNFHLFYRFYLCTLWQEQHSIRKTSKIPHTLLSKNEAAKCILLCWRPKRINYVVRMLAMTDCGYSPVHGFTVVVAVQCWSKNKSKKQTTFHNRLFVPRAGRGKGR